jgi:predicted NBD/HSP70 family sugar kinase
MDYGLGTDIFIPGMLEMDMDDHSGTLGAMVVDIYGERKTMGDYINIDAIHAQLKEQYPDESSLWLFPEVTPSELWNTSPELACIRATMNKFRDTQDDKYESFIQKLAFILGVGLSNFINLLQPKVFYYGGRTARQLPEIIDKAIELALSQRLPGMLTLVEFKESNCNEELFILGGMYQILDKIIGLVRPVSE